MQNGLATWPLWPVRIANPSCVWLDHFLSPFQTRFLDGLDHGKPGLDRADNKKPRAIMCAHISDEKRHGILRRSTMRLLRKHLDRTAGPSPPARD